MSQAELRERMQGGNIFSRDLELLLDGLSGELGKWFTRQTVGKVNRITV